MTTFKAGRSKVQIVVQARDFVLLQNVHIDSVHQTSYSTGAGVLSRVGGRGEAAGA